MREIEIGSLRCVFGMDDGDFAKVIEIADLDKQVEFKEGDELNNKTVSGGEKSRIGLAQVVVRDSQVIMLDETFSGLDEKMEERIIKRLFESYPDKTFICISHRNASRDYFDKVVDFAGMQ